MILYTVVEANRAALLDEKTLALVVVHKLFDVRDNIELLHAMPVEERVVCFGFPKLSLSDLRDCYRRLHHNAVMAMYHMLATVGGDTGPTMEAYESLMCDSDVRDYEYTFDYIHADVRTARSRLRKIFDEAPCIGPPQTDG
jgi:hypothetical protein